MIIDVTKKKEKKRVKASYFFKDVRRVASSYAESYNVNWRHLTE